MPLSCQKLCNGDKRITRRGFIKLGALATAATLYPIPGFAAFRDCLNHQRSLAFYNMHTGESLTSTYWVDGAYFPEALADINHIMRDYRTGEIRAMDPRLLDFLHSIKKRLRAQVPFHIISGYRSAKTNALLRKRCKGVAKNSYHMYGKAVDIRLPECRLSLLRRTAMDLRVGGVGYYPHSQFVHVDVGRFRCW